MAVDIAGASAELVGTASVPRSRIQVPDVPLGAVRREELLERIWINSDGPRVLLVNAAAGYGKTTLLAQWAHLCLAEGRPVAWVTCGERHSDPAVLFVDVRDALALALQEWSPGISARLMDLAIPTPESIDSVFDELVMVLDELTRSVVMVLDDLHAVQAPGSDAVTEAFAVGLPRTVHLALGMRSAPQPLRTTLRLKERLIEVTAADLALTVEQVAEVVWEAGEDPTALAEVLHKQTEGWPAAVRLGVMAARGGSLGEERALPLTYDPAVSDYLTREILATLPAAAASLLRDTAVVSEMNPGLAASMSGRPDAGQILEQLFATQALVRRIGTTEPWYVVHSLLRSHLIAELAAADVSGPARQHVAAAQWLVDHDRPDRALAHAVAAGDRELIAGLLRTGGARLVVTGSSAVALESLDVVGAAHWDDDLLGLAALARVATGDLEGARRLLADVAVQYPASAAPQLAGPPLLRVAQFSVRRLEGRPNDPELPGAFRDVLQWQANPRPDTADLDRQLLLLVSRGQWNYSTGRNQASWDDLRLALDLATVHRRDIVTLQCMSTLTSVPAFAGQAEAAARYVDDVLGLVADRGWATHPPVANIYAAGAWAAALMLQPARAERMIDRARTALRGNVDPDYASLVALVEAMLQGDQPGDPSRAMDVLARFAQGGPNAELTPILRAFAAMQRVRIMLRRGDAAGTEAAVADLQSWVPGTADAQLGLAQLEAMRGDWEACLALVQDVGARALAVEVPATDIVVPLLGAVALARLGRRPESRDWLRRALEVAEPRGVIRPFYDLGAVVRELLEEQRGQLGVHEAFVATVLGRWDAVDRDAGPDGGAGAVALTRRERDVLRELPTLMTAEEIADAQLVSVNTIRTHMRALYHKLGVRTRRDAVRRGRELGLI